MKKFCLSRHRPRVVCGLFWRKPRRRVGQRRGATRAPCWGQSRSAGGRTWRRPSAFGTSILAESDKPSRHEAAIFGKDAGLWRELSDTFGLPFFYPSVEPKLGFERREAAPPGDERDSASRPSGTTSSPHNREPNGISLKSHGSPLLSIMRASPKYYAAIAVCSTFRISQNSLRIHRLATAAAATDPGFPLAFSRSFISRHFG